MISKSIVALLCLVSVMACSHNTHDAVPRPRGFFRISPDDTSRIAQTIVPELKFSLSSEASVYISVDSVKVDDSQWLNIYYPRYNATVYCTLNTTTVGNVAKVLDNRLMRVGLNARGSIMPRRVELVDSSASVYHNLFFLSPDNVIPFQFLSTDSANFVFSGVLYMNGQINADSIAPAVEIIEDDLMIMLQNMSFNGSSD